MHPSMYDLLLLLNTVCQVTDRRLRIGGFCGEVKVLLKKCIQGFQATEEGHHCSVLTGLVETYLHDSHLHMDL